MTFKDWMLYRINSQAEQGHWSTTISIEELEIFSMDEVEEYIKEYRARGFKPEWNDYGLGIPFFKQPN